MIGYSFFEKNNILWRHHQGVIIPLSMPHCLNSITAEQAKTILKENKSFFIRWESNFDRKNSSSWWHIIKDSPENIEGLKKKVRYMIRKGNSHYEAKPCDRLFIINNGYDIYKSSFSRYITFEKILTKSEFKSSILLLPEETEFWAVFDRDSNCLVAFSENMVRDNSCFYVSMWFKPDSLKKFSSYILFHEMNLHYLNNKKLKYVSDGARSINHQTGIHDFLVSKFGFRKAYSDLNIIYKPWFFLAIKTLYPFRSLLKKSKLSFLQKIDIVLEQEHIRKTCLNIKKKH